MCEFVSYVEVDGVQFYLTKKELDSKRGLELKAYLGSQYYDDVIGHGAIDWFFDLQGKGNHLECINFSSPGNFPLEIAEAIKAGAFNIGFGAGLLTDAAGVKYHEVIDTAWAEYNKVVDAAWAERSKAVDAAEAEHRKVADAADAKYDKVTNNEFWKLFAVKENRAEVWR